MKVCEYCGNENDGKRSFCYTCGAPLGSDQAAEEVRESGEIEDVVIKLNGVLANISDIQRTFGSKRFRAVKKLCELTGVGFALAKKSYESAFDDMVQQLDRKGFAYCPICLSTRLSAKKRGGFGPMTDFEGKAGFGLADIGKSVGDEKAQMKCRDCGWAFWANSK